MLPLTRSGTRIEDREGIGMAIDQTLLLAAQGRDTAALEQVLVVCQPELRRYAARYCFTSADADDAVQESLVVLYRRLSTLRFLRALSSWLFQIACRECQRLSRKMFHRTVPLDEQIEQRYLATRKDQELRMDVAMAIPFFDRTPTPEARSLPDRRSASSAVTTPIASARRNTALSGFEVPIHGRS